MTSLKPLKLYAQKTIYPCYTTSK